MDIFIEKIRNFGENFFNWQKYKGEPLEKLFHFWGAHATP
jgi:hypothetical protein